MGEQRGWQKDLTEALLEASALLLQSCTSAQFHSPGPCLSYAAGVTMPNLIPTCWLNFLTPPQTWLATADLPSDCRTLGWPWWPLLALLCSSYRIMQSGVLPSKSPPLCPSHCYLRHHGWGNRDSDVQREPPLLLSFLGLDQDSSPGAKGLLSWRLCTGTAATLHGWRTRAKA